MLPPEPVPTNRKQKILNLTIAGVVAQVGCLTLVIVLAAVFGGLWLDANFGAGKHWFTLGLLLASVPVSIVVMLVVARVAVSKIKVQADKNKSEQKQEAGIGR